MIESINEINQLARANFLRSAIDEAFHALLNAPNYLPLHILIGDLLIREGRTQDAIDKFSTVANAYSVRGEAAQATNLLKRIIQLSPMDMGARLRLIEQLTARGQIDSAISEYMDLADLYYRLAELDLARQTFTTALRLAQQPTADRQWSIRILQRMADIDMQRLDWRQAIRLYEQLRTLRPEDPAIRENLVELYLRLAQTQQAQTEVDAFISYLDNNNRTQDILPFLEKLVGEHGEITLLRRAMADQLYRSGRVTEAVAQLDIIGDKLMEAGDKAGVAGVVRQILSMNPPNAEDYRKLLSQL